MVAGEKASLYRKHNVTLSTPLIFNSWRPQPITSGRSLLSGLSSFWEASEDGLMDVPSSLPTFCVLLPDPATTIGVFSGSSAKFPVGVESFRNVQKMTWNNNNCSTTVKNDALLAKCLPSFERWLKLENGSLVLRSVEKEDEGTYEFFFNDTKALFTLKVFGKWPC